MKRAKTEHEMVKKIANRRPSNHTAQRNLIEHVFALPSPHIKKEARTIASMPVTSSSRLAHLQAHLTHSSAT